MLTIIKPIRKRISAYLKYQEIRTDNVVFRLHCVLTAVVLVTSSLLLTSTQLVGNPIECITSGKDDYLHAVNTFCWIMTTYTMPEEFYKEKVQLQKQLHQQFTSWNPSMWLGRVRRDISKDAHALMPGVFNEFDTRVPKRYYSYYQWVCFVLFLQAIMCYLPKVLWDMREGGLLEKLATGLHGYCQKEERGKKTDNLICYLLKYRRKHKMYVFSYWGCEALCLLNIVLQMWMMNAFLGGQFLSYGRKVLEQSHLPQHERYDPMIYVFPRVTKCVFFHVGPSGSIVNIDSLCVLPQNVINEKVYIFLWFWYIILATVLSVVMVYRVLLTFLPIMRPHLLALRSRSPKIRTVTEITSSLDIGDYWLFYMLAKNMNPLAYEEFIMDYAHRTGKDNGLLKKDLSAAMPLWPTKSELK